MVNVWNCIQNYCLCSVVNVWNQEHKPMCLQRDHRYGIVCKTICPCSVLKSMELYENYLPCSAWLQRMELHTKLSAPCSTVNVWNCIHTNYPSCSMLNVWNCIVKLLPCMR
ncbi:hypothetical protein AVEN_174518-1 [Araneus ventricosus]|uniref:Uncharacterized protein n=1 Tax=Araneus ventricosus TaxID=182803 RepID=A0A4Y2T0T8_ARAVE|nr:hypothetical protein AVEN_174518-1 [Araneus ventricosus]